MANNDLTAKIRITGDANQLSTELVRSENELRNLGKTAADIKVLEGAEANVRRFEGELQAAQGKVRSLQTALSEAYAVDADAPLLRRLGADLATAEKEALKAESALTKSQAAVVKLNLSAGQTGVSTSTLAQASSQLAAETAKVTANIDSLRTKITAAANAEEMLAARTKSVAGAFGTLNIRSAETIKADIAAINQALVKLASNSSLSADEFDRAFAAGQGQIAKLNAELSGLPVETAAKGVSGLTSAFSSLQGVLGSLGIAAVGQKFLDANLAADKLQKSLNAVNGDSAKTASDLAFLKDTAQRLGINLESSSSAFVKLAAAAKGTALEGQATRDIFSGIGSAMSQLGLSSAETERAFAAIGQMMSKGTVNAEELKGQLGDVLPGALSIAARATGLTTQELGKLMETGGLLAEDFLPKFAAEAKKSFGGAAGEAQGLSNTIERVKNQWSQAFKVFGDTGVLASLAGILGIVNEAFLILATGVTTVTSGFFAFVKGIGVVAGAIRTLDFSGLKDGLAAIGKELVDNVTQMASLTSTSKLVGEALSGAGDAANKAAATAATAGVGWEKLVVAYDQAAKSAADYVEMAKKVATANNDQASVLVKIAELSGNENNLLIAKEEAARQAAIGSDNLAQALDREAKTLQAKVIALQEEIKGQKIVSEEKIKAIEEAKKLAEAKGEEARAALSGADAARVAAAAAEAESAARYDNSLRVKELKVAYEEAALKVDVLRAAQANGVAVDAELTVAQTALAKASNLYNDALRDQAAMIVNANSLKQSQLSMEQAVIRLAIEQRRTSYELAMARGDEAAAARELIAIKRLEIQLAELTANAKKLEAQAALAKVQADREELQAKGALTEAVSLELQAREAAAGVKMKEAEIASELARRMKDLINTTSQAGSAARGSSGGFDSLAGSMNKAADAASRLRGAQGGGSGPNGGVGGTGSPEPTIGASGSTLDDPNYDHRTFFDGNGKPGSFGNQANRSVSGLDALYKSGATVQEAQVAAKYLGELTMRYAQAGSGQVKTTEDNNRLIATSTARAVQDSLRMARTELATGVAADLGPSVADITAKNLALLSNRQGAIGGAAFDQYRDTVSASAQEAQRGVTQPVNITIGGKTQSLNVASQADAQNLSNILRLLESDSMRSF